MPFKPTSVSVTQYSDSILLMTLDLPDKGANVLSQQMFDELESAITPWLTRDDIEGLILVSGKPKIFVAGANLNEIQAGLDWPDEKIVEFSRRGRQVMSLFNTAPFTTVAAIHGACVGGGFELALWCDYRVATEDRRTIIGLPEVKLGLIPGWAGTVRVGRLAGIETQLDLVTSAKLISASDAEEAGLVDQVSAEARLIEDAVNLIQTSDRDGVLQRRKSLEFPLPEIDVEQLTRKYTKEIARPGNSIYPVAPLIALEHMLRSAKLPMEAACESESKAFAEAWGSEPSYGLLHNFFLSDYAKKLPAEFVAGHAVRDFNSVAVIGLGVMGRAIAKLHQNTENLFLVESDPAIVESVRCQFPSDNIQFVASVGQLPDVELVIEAIPEVLAQKQALLKDVEKVVGADALIVTNTSAISVTELANSLSHPERFCGMHFCHPTLMQLVEIIPGKATSGQAMAQIVQHIRTLRKLSIVVQDSPGFVVNRLLSCLFQKSIEAVLRGVPVERVDHVMREFGFQVGPFEMLDIIGIDTCVFRRASHVGRRAENDRQLSVASSDDEIEPLGSQVRGWFLSI